MKQTIKVYVQFQIIEQEKSGMYIKNKKEMIEFKSYLKFLQWKKSMKLYIEMRKENFLSFEVYFDAYIKDITNGTTWKTVNILTEDGTERIVYEEEVPYLKDKVWDNDKGWTLIPIQYKLLDH